MLQTYGLMSIMGSGTFINAILQVLNAAGSVVFENLPLIFAMGVAIGMAKQEKEVSALSAAIAFFIMHATIGAMIGAYRCPRFVWCNSQCTWHRIPANGRIRWYSGWSGYCCAAQPFL